MAKLDVATQRSHLRSCMDAEANALVEQYLRVGEDEPVAAVINRITDHYQRVNTLI